MKSSRMDFIPVLPSRSVRNTSSPREDVHPQVSFCCECPPSAFNLVKTPEPLWHAGDRVEKQLVLSHLRPGSGTKACALDVHADCIAAGAPHCHVFLHLYETPSDAYVFCLGYDTE